ncbi:MAG: tRNA lysidine(34) synthetase TilS [Rhizobiales bacterium]|nr:tRNA lysidine(34) synthetase TilS [Hyphomicrobiales bacterium]
MSNADGGASPLVAAEVRPLFADLADCPVLVLAVSGGPDSTALLLLAARWRKTRRHGPALLAVTVDHGLRPEARREAAAVKRFARSLGVAHRTLRWTGRKPSSGLQEKARFARYRLLAEAARKAGAAHVLTAHTLDDQAETVLIRLARGSGISGLAAMSRAAPLPEAADLTLARPLLDVPKARLIATLRQAGVAYADDPSNRNPTFTRVRLRDVIMPALASEGLGAARLALLARRVRRAEAALEAAVDEAAGRLAPGPWPPAGPIEFPAASFNALPDEVALRLLGRAIGAAGDEGPVELGKLEALAAALAAPEAASTGSGRFRRTLAGAVVTRARDRLTVERAPPRRGGSRPKR